MLNPQFKNLCWVIISLSVRQSPLCFRSLSWTIFNWLSSSIRIVFFLLYLQVNYRKVKFWTWNHEYFVCLLQVLNLAFLNFYPCNEWLNYWHLEEHSGSVGRVLDSGLCSRLARHFILCLILVQLRKTGNCPNMTEENVDWDIKHQHKLTKQITDKLHFKAETYLRLIRVRTGLKSTWI